MRVVPEHLASAPVQHEVLAHLAGNSRCNASTAKQDLPLVPERETKETRQGDASIVERCRAPGETVGAKPVNSPFRTEGQLAW